MMNEIIIKGTVTPVNSTVTIPLPWYFGTSYTKILRRLKEKKACKYYMFRKKKVPVFNSCSQVSRMVRYPQFY